MKKEHVPLFKKKKTKKNFASNFSNKVILADQMSDRGEGYYPGTFAEVEPFPDFFSPGD